MKLTVKTINNERYEANTRIDRDDSSNVRAYRFGDGDRDDILGNPVSSIWHQHLVHVDCRGRVVGMGFVQLDERSLPRMEYSR